MSFKNIDEQLLRSTWKILQVVPSSESGKLKVWFMLQNGQMYCINVLQNIKLYVNSKVFRTNLT